MDKAKEHSTQTLTCTLSIGAVPKTSNIGIYSANAAPKCVVRVALYGVLHSVLGSARYDDDDDDS